MSIGNGKQKVRDDAIYQKVQVCLSAVKARRPGLEKKDPINHDDLTIDFPPDDEEKKSAVVHFKKDAPEGSGGGLFAAAVGVPGKIVGKIFGTPAKAASKTAESPIELEKKKGRVQPDLKAFDAVPE